MHIDIDAQTAVEVMDVADWYDISPQDYIRILIKRDLDRVMEDVNPQLACWNGRQS